MPRYEYKCRECNTVFTKNVTVSQRQGIQECTACGKKSAEKIFSVVAMSVSGGNVADSDFLPSSPCANGACGL